MTGDPQYHQDLIDMAQRIRRISPADIVHQFKDSSGFTPSNYHTCLPHFTGKLTAVDGSNVMVIEGGNFSVAAVRAAECTFAADRRVHRSVTPLRIVSIGPEPTNRDFSTLYQECFAEVPEAQLENEDRARAAAVIRDLLEYWTAYQALSAMAKGDVLVFDGALRVGHASQDRILAEILKRSAQKRILVAAVTKRTSATWGGGYPIVPAASGLADELGIAPPWYVKIPQDLLDRERYEQWHRGDVYVARLHPHAPRAFKVEVPRAADADEIGQTFSALAALSLDGRVTGYPFPLLDAHLTAVIRSDVSDQIQQDLIFRLGALGMDFSEYQDLFGDYHDEFARY
jgi:hypothetical protein